MLKRSNPFFKHVPGLEDTFKILLRFHDPSVTSQKRRLNGIGDFNSRRHSKHLKNVLKQANGTKPYIVRTDASNYAVGAVLLQDLEEEEKQGIVISVDLQHIMPIKGAIIISESNFTEPSVQQKISELLPGGKADVILSDMAPKASGMSHIDSVEILKLVYSALSFAVLTLKKRGVFLCKVWDSNEVETLYSNLQNLFTTVKRIKPKASRSDSSELFILAKGFKGIK
ncbi:rRNA methyltransferase 2, mitochondrial [Parasteatoda tepidariorum]|uniref:rRNA methyltransferase 2, mitochondrial n=1 Tax=Parasteatoda tepidariorum TaxID=114398 RepID=UPI0039BCC19B